VVALAPPDRPLPLFSADVVGTRSEWSAAVAAAHALHMPVTGAPFPREALLEDWASATWHAEVPIVTHVNALPFRRLAATAGAAGVRAALTGEGADELFYGYGELAGRRLHHAAAVPARAARRMGSRLPGPLGPAIAHRGASQADFLVDLAGGFAHQRLADAGTEAFAFLPPRQAARQGEVLVWLGEHLATLLQRNDAMGMAASVEARFPYLDERLVRFGVNLPVSAKVAFAPRLGDPRHPFLVDKAIVRRTAARHLPPEIAGREKLGFPSHGHDAVRTTTPFFADGYVAEILGLDRPATDHLVDEVDPLLVAKLASVEVFGRLFARQDPVEAVAAHLCRTVTMP
jgi:asparagine synthase (glutamine-hydrolysing)